MSVPKPIPTKATTVERAAVILAEAIGHRRPGADADREVCKRYGITTRTLRRHRERMDRDEGLSLAVQGLLAPSRERWAARLSRAKEQALQMLLDSMAAQDASRPESLAAITQASRFIQQSTLEEAALDVWLAGQLDGPPDGEQDYGDSRAVLLISETADPPGEPPEEERSGKDHDAALEPAPAPGVLDSRRAAP